MAKNRRLDTCRGIDWLRENINNSGNQVSHHQKRELQTLKGKIVTRSMSWGIAMNTWFSFNRDAMSACMCTWAHAYSLVLSRVGGPRSDDTPIATTMPCAQRLVSKHHFPLIGTRAPWTNGWYQGCSKGRTRWAWTILCSKNDGDESKEHRSQHEGAPTGQTGNNLSRKINNDSNRL